MDSVNSLKKYLFYSNKVVIDSFAFRLHYRYTFVLLLACSIIVTIRQYFGEPILCMQNGKSTKSMIRTFCWIQSTFSVANATDGPYAGVSKFTDDNKQIYHTYYQWVPILLVFEAFCFYMPHYLWKLIEKGRIGALLKDLGEQLVPPESNKHLTLLANYIVNGLNRNSNFLFIAYIFVELLNLINLFAQMVLLNRFFHYEYFDFGFKVYEYFAQKSKINPLTKVFPLITKCTFQDFGGSGDIQKHDILCVLSVNVINEKIFTFIWFYLAFLLIITSVCVICLLFRLIILKHIKCLYRFCLTFSFKDERYGEIVADLYSQISYYDYLVLILLSKNLSSANYLFLIGQIQLKLKQQAIKRQIQRQQQQQQQRSALSPIRTSTEHYVNKSSQVPKMIELRKF